MAPGTGKAVELASVACRAATTRRMERYAQLFGETHATGSPSTSDDASVALAMEPAVAAREPPHNCACRPHSVILACGCIAVGVGLVTVAIGIMLSSPAQAPTRESVASQTRTAPPVAGPSRAAPPFLPTPPLAYSSPHPPASPLPPASPHPPASLHPPASPPPSSPRHPPSRPPPSPPTPSLPLLFSPLPSPPPPPVPSPPPVPCPPVMLPIAPVHLLGNSPFCTEHWCGANCCDRCTAQYNEEGQPRPHILYMHIEKTGGSVRACCPSHAQCGDYKRHRADGRGGVLCM